MGQKQEDSVRAFIAGWECSKWDADLIDRMLDRMTSDIQYHVYAWERPVVGRAAVRDELLRQAPMFTDVRSEIVSIASANHTVLVERRDSMMIGRKPLMQHVVGVFEVDNEGKISRWRDYYDSVECAVKLGADVSKVSTAGARGYEP
jgi:limonene-1,2-epoxide hydrolase